MSTEQGKLYRSNIQFHPITINGSPQFNESSDQFIQSKKLCPQRKISHQTSQKQLKVKHQRSTQQCTKPTLPYSTLNELQNTTFISIDEVYLNPGFSKNNHLADSRQTRNPKKNLTDLQSDVESIGCKSLRSFQGQEQYYKYWKTKAHEYLDENFKLREQNKNLKNELQIIQKQKLNKKPQLVKNVTNQQIVKKGQKSFLYLENLFKKKLNDLQNQVKDKNFKIISLEQKIVELNKKLLGQLERIQLLERLGKQIEILTKQNIALKKQSYLYQNQQPQKYLKEQNIKCRSTNTRYPSKEKTLFGSSKNLYKR